MKQRWYLLLGFVLPTISLAADNPIDRVNVWIGTGGKLSAPGFTFPGAASPFGKVRLGPDTEFGSPIKKPLNKTNMATSGYSYHHDRIIGFSHSRYSGTGVAEGGLFRVRPVLGESSLLKRAGAMKLVHKNETAGPGYYGVELKKENLRAELTTSTHCGFHRYSKMTSAKDKLGILLNVSSGLFNSKTGPISTVEFFPASNTFRGSTRLLAQFSSRYGGLPAYFYGSYNVRPETIKVWQDKSWLPEGTLGAAGAAIGSGLIFSPETPSVELILCISYVSPEGAQKNFESEAQNQSFTAAKNLAEREWNSWLGRLQFETSDKNVSQIMATALYHAMLMPTHFGDVDGKYLGFDDQIHQAQGFTYRTDMSLWDTFRTTHPLYTLIAPEIQRDSLHSLLDMGQRSGVIPRWPSGAGDSGSMFGSPANFLFAESYLKDQRDFDAPLALQMMVRDATTAPPSGVPGRDLTCFQNSFCAKESTHGSVSKTLEYAWADFAIANLADALKMDTLADQFLELSQRFLNVWDPKSKFFRPRNTAGKFLEFSPNITSYLGFLGKNTDAYVEGSPWQWRFSAPHASTKLVELFGGAKAFVKELESFVCGASKSRGALYPGAKYWHGNQHDIHAIYLFNDAGRPDLTQKWVRWALKERYANTPSGLDGNDDAGTLSAWYVFSAIGLYPQAGTNKYWLGSPNIESATLTLGDHKTLKVKVIDQEIQNIYVQRVTLNGKTVCAPVITHQELVNGELEFQMGPIPAVGGGYNCLK